jgi:hypothetical protein
MKNKRKSKKRLVRTLKCRSKKIKKERLDKAWLNIWVKAGVLKKEG